MTQTFPPGAYWIIASNPSNLMAIYTNLNTNNVFGPYTGTLANGGETCRVWPRPTTTACRDPSVKVLEKLPCRSAILIYGDGGAWGQWSDGLGSSMELIDLEGDVKHPSNWADSNDTGESLWTSIEYNGPVGEIWALRTTTA
jgi:hypothetical protein